MAFFAKYCTTCHSPTGADPSRDFTDYAQIQADSPLIACGVNPGPSPLPTCDANGPRPRQFPAGGPKPTDEERSRLVQWIADGMPL
jgi:hypothetical protein